ncbi:hypothetical protein ACFYQ5_03145 [Streptomyces sp. NPDC005794]|uniref:hypothetical protein n=1 Tax=Streptomyces sp. NPDC005794 TaxID=3364733 RepID=UPI0036AE1E5D
MPTADEQPVGLPVLRPLGPELLSAVVCAVAAVESVLLGLLLEGQGFCGASAPHSSPG